MGFTPGDVLSYIPKWHHCRETTAFVREDGIAVDTFWRHTDSSAAVLSEEEIATAEVRFNVNEFDALDIYSHSSRETWLTYHPDDRGRIPSQHGLQEALFVRKGAEPDLETQIANARREVEEALSEVDSAQRRLEWRREDLAKLEAGRVG
jgi:hypothetical protein